jgi:hypothetical protein
MMSQIAGGADDAPPSASAVAGSSGGDNGADSGSVHQRLPAARGGVLPSLESLQSQWGAASQAASQAPPRVLGAALFDDAFEIDDGDVRVYVKRRRCCCCCCY